MSSVTSRRMLSLICPVCQKPFTRAANQIHTDHPLCSQSCAGKYRGVPEWQRKKATEASRVTYAKRRQQALGYYFGPMSDRDWDIFRKGYAAGYERARRKTRREQAA